MSNKSDLSAKFNNSFEGAEIKALELNALMAFCWFYQVNLLILEFIIYIFFKSQCLLFVFKVSTFFLYKAQTCVSRRSCSILNEPPISVMSQAERERNEIESSNKL